MISGAESRTCSACSETTLVQLHTSMKVSFSPRSVLLFVVLIGLVVSARNSEDVASRFLPFIKDTSLRLGCIWRRTLQNTEGFEWFLHAFCGRFCVACHKHLGLQDPPPMESRMPAFNEAKVEVEYLRVVRDEHLWQICPEDVESIEVFELGNLNFDRHGLQCMSPHTTRTLYRPWESTQFIDLVSLFSSVTWDTFCIWAFFLPLIILNTSIGKRWEPFWCIHVFHAFSTHFHMSRCFERLEFQASDESPAAAGTGVRSTESYVLYRGAKKWCLSSMMLHLDGSLWMALIAPGCTNYRGTWGSTQLKEAWWVRAGVQVSFKLLVLYRIRT